LERALTKHSAIVQTGTIVVIVGTERKNYTLHEKLLTHHSQYSRCALSGNFKESDDRVVTLEDVDTEAFDFLVDWLYDRKLPAFQKAWDVNRMPLRLHAYVLADRLLMPLLKKAIFDYYFEIYMPKNIFPSYSAIGFAFTNLPARDPLLQLWIDAFCVNNGIEIYKRVFGECDSQISTLPQEALARLLQKTHTVANLSAEEKALKRTDYTI